MRGVGVVCLLAMIGALMLGGRPVPAAAATVTFSPLPVAGVSPADGQIVPTSRAVVVALDTSTRTWTTVRQQFATGHFALRLAWGTHIEWFIPSAFNLSTGSLSVSSAITYDAGSGTVTADPALALGTTYSATLAVKDAAQALLAQDLGQSPTGTDLCCDYSWSFTTADAAATASSTTITGSGTAGGSLAGGNTLSLNIQGSGTITTASYAGNPISTSSSFPAGTVFFDLSTSLGNTFRAITVMNCGSGRLLWWYTGSAWQKVSPQSASGGCVTASLSGTSSPTVGQLTGTAFAAAPTVTVTGVSPRTARTGDTVEVQGNGFTGATDVQFGGISVAAGAFTVVSDSLIEVWSVPAGSGTVDVTVTSGGAGSTTGPADQFTYATGSPQQHLAIPAYIQPGTADWTAIDNAAPTVGLTVINPLNGPGSGCSTAYQAQVAASQAKGIAVLGYVYTRYANTVADYNGTNDKTIAEVESEIDQYYQCYPTLDGIFFDEVTTDCADATSYYQVLSAYVKSKGGKGITAINPGIGTNECYMDAADILVTYEGDAAGYLTSTQPSWVSNYPADRFWHLLYDAPDAASTGRLVTLAQQRNAGWVYVTPNPPSLAWNSVATDPYWSAELAALQGVPSINVVSSNPYPSNPGWTYFNVSGSGFAPNSPLTITVHYPGVTQTMAYSPQFYTSLMTDSSGNIDPQPVSWAVACYNYTGWGTADVTISDAAGHTVTQNALPLYCQSGSIVNATNVGVVPSATTDNTAALQQAINNLEAGGGGILYLPAGTYGINPAVGLNIGSNVSVIGDGAILKPTAPGFQFLDVSGSHTLISGVTLDGAEEVTRGVSVENGSTNVIFSRDLIENITQTSNPSDPNYTATPIGVRIYGGTDGIRLDTVTVSNVVAVRPECSTCTPVSDVARGVLISPGTAPTIPTNVTIQRSTFHLVGPRDDGDCVVIQGSSQTANLTIDSNSFDFCAKRAIKIQTPGVTVSNNTIVNPYLNDNSNSPSYTGGTLKQDMYAAISDYASNVSIQNNTIGGIGSFYNGIEIGDGTCPALSGISVTGNTVSMGPSASLTGTSSIRMMSPGTVSITNNTLSNANYGITTYPGTPPTVSGNTFTNITTQMQPYGTCS